MALSRRSLLAGGGALAAGILAGCGPLGDLGAAIGGPRPPAAWPAPASRSWRALSRLTFGPRPEELARVDAIGLAAWVEEQLASQTIDDAPAELQIRRLDGPFADSSAVFELEEERVRGDVQAAALLRAVYSRRQLYELMVDFWGDHFSISINKDELAWLKPIDDREVIRPHALGSFGELLWASMNSPAMLIYLDNQQNLAGNPNENYARELLELHSLGLAANYSQADVQELARCLTGWTVDAEGPWRGTRRFAAERHDDGPKRLLGQDLPAGGGERDLERAHGLIMAHPALPQFIAAKLVRRFVADEPPAALVAAAAAAFSQSGGSIAATLRAILLAPAFAAAPRKYKRPLHYVAGALRQLGAASDGGPPLHAALGRMGQPLFQWPTPDGFPDRTAAWTAGLLPRWQFALALAGGTLAGTRIDLAGLRASAGAADMAGWLDRLGELLLGAPLPAALSARLIARLGPALSDEGAALALASLLAAPQYQWR